MLKKPVWLKTDSPQIEQFDILIGWDSEFYPDLKNPIKQQLISYQFAGYWKKTCQYFEHIIYSEERLSLSEIIIQILESLSISQWDIIKESYKILLVAHYSIAEWSMLKNRHLLVKNLVEVYQTLTSFKPFRLNVFYKKRNVSIEIFWQDTYLYTDRNNRSLKKISSQCFNKKVEISEKYSIEKMNEFLKKDKEKFEEYALTDARITLEYYCQYMKDFYENSKVEEIPLTLGDSSVKWFLKHLENKSIRENKTDENGKKDKKWYEKKILGIEWTNGRKRQKNKDRWVDELFANNTYLGAINTSYYIGKFDSPEHWILDIDISNCYPTSLAVQPIIDWGKHSKKYVLYDLLKEKASIRNNSIEIGIFKIDKFKFEPEVYQTSFPIPNDGGLIYTMEGKDIYTTYPEVVTAIEQGVKFESKSPEEVRIFEELKDENNQPILAFSDFLKFLIENRNKYKESPFKANIFKQMYLSFYGKLGQGITERYTYNLIGEEKKHPISKITVPHYASTCTSLVRSAIVEIVNYFQAIEGIQVLNATTDGMMVAIPKKYFPKDFKPEVDENGKVDCQKISFEKIFPSFFWDLNTKYSIKHIVQGRKNLGQNISWIEVKYFGDLAHTWKTRVNCIVYQGVTQNIARVSMDKGVQTYEDILKYDIEEISEVEDTSLASVKDIIKYKSDLVPKKNLQDSKEKSKKINIDNDYKRYILADTHSTRTFKNIAEWEEHRKILKGIRKTGKRATYDLVEIKKNENKIRLIGSLQQIVTRSFITEIFKNDYLPKEVKNKEIIFRLSQWKNDYLVGQKWEINENLIKKCRIKAKSLSYYPKIKMTKKIEEQIKTMCAALGMNIEKTEILFKNIAF